MEEEKDPSQEYIRAFNLGYIIAEKEPMIAELLATAKGDSQTLLAFKAGQEEWKNSDYLKSKLPSFLKDDPFSKSDNAPEPDKDMDIEPDK